MAAFTLAGIVWTTLFAAVIFRSMWTWFVLPLWPRQISYAEAVGVLLIFSFVRGLQVIEHTSRPWHFGSFMQREALKLVAYTVFWGIAAGLHALLF